MDDIKLEIREGMPGHGDREEIERLRAFIESRGYRRCDIMVCNCGSFHGGHAESRLSEIDEALPDANGPTILQRVQALRAENKRLREALEGIAAHEGQCIFHHGDCCRAASAATFAQLAEEAREALAKGGG